MRESGARKSKRARCDGGQHRVDARQHHSRRGAFVSWRKMRASLWPGDSGRRRPTFFAGLLIILLFWSRSLIHTLTLIRWPLEFGHNFFYITCTLAQALAFTRLTDPFWWFVLCAVFSALVWGLFTYDMRMIRMREADSRSEDALRLYRIVLRDQRLNIWFLVPAILLFNIACAIAIRVSPGFFLLHNGHLILIGLQAAGLMIYLWYVIRAFVKITPLIADARHDWRSAETGEAGPRAD